MTHTELEEKQTQQSRKSGQFVVPGEPLGVIEEFMAGSGTYVEEGIIHSKTIGRTLLDMLSKEVSIYSLGHTLHIPRTGCTVIGQVSEVQNRMATLHIVNVGKRQLAGFFTGTLYVSDTGPGFVETMYDACRAGDIVRAKVISEKNRMVHLSTVDENLGVIHAFCSRCGNIVSLSKQRLQCTVCGKIERRKIASDYGEETLLREKNENKSCGKIGK